MGTPIRPADLILGIHTVDPAEFAPAERLLIIERVLEWCKPALKYMPGFTEIGHEMNKRLGTYSVRTTDLNVVQFADVMSEYSRCAFLAEVFAMTTVAPHTWEHTNLLLRQEGGIVRWTRRYKIEDVHNQGYRGHQSGSREVTLSLKLEHLFGGELEKALDPRVFVSVLSAVKQLVVKCVEDRQRHLASMENLLGSIENVRRHINQTG